MNPSLFLLGASGTRRRALRCVTGLLLASGLGTSMAQDAVPSVSLEAARSALADGKAIVFDIREPQEHAAGVAAGMRLLPMSQIGARLAEIPKASDRPVLLICNTQNRSRKVAQALLERGYTQVRYVAGGMSGWVAKGWPLVAPAR
jgi:rhodanese-related sulfurtransferase